jgi:hypothetical protein
MNFFNIFILLTVKCVELNHINIHYDMDLIKTHEIKIEHEK